MCTLNGAPVLSATARMLGVGLDALSDLALSAPAGADGLVLVPYLEGERTPNLPQASGSLHGLRQRNTTPAHVARAAVEGLLCSLNTGVGALLDAGVRADRVILVGGGARSRAVRENRHHFGRPVVVPVSGEYVADGAARQALWALSPGTLPAVAQHIARRRVRRRPAPGCDRTVCRRLGVGGRGLARVSTRRRCRSLSRH